MTILKKKIKLLLFFLAFIIIAPIIVLYANGDILGGGWNILATGGIYVTKAPVGSSIFLNSKLKGATSFFERNFLIKSLASGSYEISVKKDGYYSWTEKITVTNNFVAEADIFMLPQQTTLRPITAYTLVEKKAGTSTIPTRQKNQEYAYVAALFSSAPPISTASDIFSTSSIDFIDNLGTAESPIMSDKLGLWQESGKVYVEWFGDDDSAPEYLCEKSDCSDPLLVSDLKSAPTRIGFLPGYDDVVIVASGNKIFAIQTENYSSKIPQVIYQGNHPDFRIDDGDLYLKDNDGFSEILI